MRAPGGGVVDLRCGGAPMVKHGTRDVDPQPLDPDHSGGNQIGKRYVDAGGTLEVLCTKPGEGTLSLGGAPLELAEAKALPSSD